MEFFVTALRQNRPKSAKDRPKLIDLVLKMTSFMLNMMDLVLKMMDFRLKMMGFMLTARDGPKQSWLPSHRSLGMKSIVFQYEIHQFWSILSTEFDRSDVVDRIASRHATKLQSIRRDNRQQNCGSSTWRCRDRPGGQFYTENDEHYGSSTKNVDSSVEM